MSAKQLVRLAIVLAGVLLLWGAVALASKRGQDRGDRSSLIRKLDTAAIDTIALMGRADSTILVRNRAGAKDATQRWRVNGNPTDPQTINDLLSGLADSEQSAEVVARSPASHARLHVTPDSGRLVRVIGHGRTLLDWMVGKQTVESDGVYLRQPNAPEVYVLRSRLATALARPADDWRSHTVSEINTDSVGAVEVVREGKSYALRRRGTGWILSSASQPDSAKVAGLLSSYRELRVSGFGDRLRQDSLSQLKPRRTARLLDRQGKQLLSMVFDSTSSGFWVQAKGAAARGSPEEWYRLESWTVDQLTPADSTLRKH